MKRSMLFATLIAGTLLSEGGSDMPMLKWAGKDKVVNHHNEVPFRVLERKWGCGNHAHTEAQGHGEENLDEDAKRAEICGVGVDEVRKGVKAIMFKDLCVPVPLCDKNGTVSCSHTEAQRRRERFVQ